MEPAYFYDLLPGLHKSIVFSFAFTSVSVRMRKKLCFFSEMPYLVKAAITI